MDIFKRREMDSITRRRTEAWNSRQHGFQNFGPPISTIDGAKWSALRADCSGHHFFLTHTVIHEPIFTTCGLHFHLGTLGTSQKTTFLILKLDCVILQMLRHDQHDQKQEGLLATNPSRSYSPCYGNTKVWEAPHTGESGLYLMAHPTQYNYH